MSETLQKKVELLNSQMIVHQSSDQSHISHRFFLPEGIESLTISFSYSPKFVEYGLENQEIVRKAFDFYDDKLVKNKKVVKDFSPFKNLLTISIEDPIGFRGNCHRFHPEGYEIHVSDENSTPGVLNREMKSGMWTITINSHCILSETCDVQLIVHGTQSIHQDKRWYNKPFKDIEKINFTTNKESESPSKNSAYSWKRSEIHCHTNHSDGVQTVEELVSKAKELNISCLAITDHNTMSATEKLEQLEATYGVKLMRGIEWTTFYGHMLTLGYDQLTAINWSNVGPTSIEESIQEVKKEGAIVGIAHPYQLGSPFCTGCYWEYETLNLDYYDFIEVWNGETPHISRINKAAFETWTELLNQGARIPATCGRDWHVNETSKQLAFLYLYLPENPTIVDMRQAIKRGNSFVSMGPKIEFNAANEYISGDVLSVHNQDQINVQIDISEYNDSYAIVIDSNVGAVYRSDCEGDIRQTVEVKTNIDSQQVNWIRLLVYSDRRELIAFTNPIYFEAETYES